MVFIKYKDVMTVIWEIQLRKNIISILGIQIVIHAILIYTCRNWEVIVSNVIMKIHGMLMSENLTIIKLVFR